MLGDFLAVRCQLLSKQWSKWLSVAEFWYNTSFHSALGRSPLEVLYGHKPKQLGIINPADSHSVELDQWLYERNKLNEVVRDHLQRAQLRMKQHADKNRLERQFKEGDLVYLKLQPYIQSSVVARSNQKLSFRYYGPYKVLARVGPVAYRLELPSDARVHPVVHVSQLKQHVAPTVQVQSDLSDLTVDPNLVVSPVAFTDSRLVLRGASMINQVRVQWNAAEHPLMTWEEQELNDLKRRFPKTPAWGQPDFRGGGNVRHRRKECKVR